MVGSRRYTFVTVAFFGEAGLLRLQARSMRLYCPAELVDEIIVVDNSRPVASNRWRAGLLHHYGALAKQVRFLSRAELATMPADIDGWWTQQVLKIKVADVIRSDRYVLLDAKNLLVSELRRDFLETQSGLPRLNAYPHVNPQMRRLLARTLSYLGIDPAPHLDWFTRTATPFTMLTSQARELVRYVEDREGKPFGSAFLERELAEFFLYSGFLESKGLLKSSYDLTQPYCAQIWEEAANETGCAEAIRAVENSDCPFMSIHRRAIAKLNQKSITMVAEFWRSRGLFPSLGDATQFLRDPNRVYQDRNGHVYPWPLSYFVFQFERRWKTAFTRRGTLH